MIDVLNFCKENLEIVIMILFFSYCIINSIMENLTEIFKSRKNKDKWDS